MDNKEEAEKIAKLIELISIGLKNMVEDICKENIEFEGINDVLYPLILQLVTLHFIEYMSRRNAKNKDVFKAVDRIIKRSKCMWIDMNKMTV